MLSLNTHSSKQMKFRKNARCHDDRYILILSQNTQGIHKPHATQVQLTFSSSYTQCVHIKYRIFPCIRQSTYKSTSFIASRVDYCNGLLYGVSFVDYR